MQQFYGIFGIFHVFSKLYFYEEVDNDAPTWAGVLISNFLPRYIYLAPQQLYSWNNFSEFQ